MNLFLRNPNIKPLLNLIIHVCLKCIYCKEIHIQIVYQVSMHEVGCIYWKEKKVLCTF